MIPKKKNEPSTSDSATSTNSSSVSSTGSSTSGDSSSSDSESSTSGQKTTDSSKNKKTIATKKTAPSKTKSASQPKVKDKNVASRSAPPVKKQQIYSDSDSEESSKKVAAPKKATSRVKRKTSVSSSVPKLIQQKNAKSAKSEETRKAESKTASTDKNKSSNDDPKNTKKTSIFSPHRSKTPPPPKLTPMKNVATKKVPLRSKRKNIAKLEKASSSNVPNKSSSASSLVSSGNSTDSDRGKVKVETKTQKKAKPVTVTTLAETNIIKPRGRGRPRKNVDNSKAVQDKIITRKQSQSKVSNVTRVSKLYPSVGNNFTDSDSSTGGKLSSTSSRSYKRTKSISQRKDRIGKNSAISDSSQLSLVEIAERTCPVEGCDSSGHLNGQFEKHFTMDSCPLYHNLTFKQCQINLSERLKREEERKKLKSASDLEKNAYKEKVSELRMKDRPSSTTPDEVSENQNNGEREPDLWSHASAYDVKLFQEAQAISSERIEEELKGLPNVKGTKYIEIGKHEMEVWYQSPYPEEFVQVPKLYICEFCLNYMKGKTTFNRHTLKCIWRHPPGEEVYRKDKISVWEVDGRKYKTYSQNLCLLAKFFLDHKTLYYDVEPFLFYIMTINDNEGCHIVGYFSKEKNSFLNFNVSCILTLPPYQRQGYGRLLIDFSYLLTRVEGKIGSPEKPLSDLGLISYRSYWKDVLLERLCSLDGKQISIKDMSQELAINSYDIVSTLQVLGMMKYWKGKHIILKKEDYIKEYNEKKTKRRWPTNREIDPKCLRWHPPTPVTHTPNAS